MKTHSKIIYEKHYTSTSKWGKKIESYIRIERHFDFKEGLRYSVSVPNCCFCKKRLQDAMLWAMEHESIGMAKYESLKYQIERKKLWNSVDE